MSPQIVIKPVVKIRPKTGKPSLATPVNPWFAIYTDGIPSQCRFINDSEAGKQLREFLTSGGKHL
jgi:hypothetical protein